MHEEYDLIIALNKLKRSKFRSSFKLDEKDIDTINKKGFEIIRQHAFEILNNRIKIKKQNDGRQTPLKGYFIFIAQHATATCCRGCIKKWYNIPENSVLSNQQLDFFADLLVFWIKQQIKKNTPSY